MDHHLLFCFSGRLEWLPIAAGAAVAVPCRAGFAYADRPAIANHPEYRDFDAYETSRRAGNHPNFPTLQRPGSDAGHAP